jgi:hypothetical protein
MLQRLWKLTLSYFLSLLVASQAERLGDQILLISAFFIVAGVGSGFTISLPSATTFHLCMLYTTTRHEREQLAAAAAAGVVAGGGGEQRLAANRMLVHNAAMYPDNPDADAPRFFEVQPAVRQLCRTLDGFIFVVDASSDAQIGWFTLYLIIGLNIFHFTKAIAWKSRLNF